MSLRRCFFEINNNLRRVSGEYIFAQRLVLEHFAKIYVENNGDES